MAVLELGLAAQVEPVEKGDSGTHLHPFIVARVAARLPPFGPVLVAGAGGFVGGHLVRSLLEHRTEVHALVRPGTQLDASMGLTVHEIDAACTETTRACLLEVRPFAVVNLVRSRRAEGAGLAALVRDNVIAAAVLLDASSLAGCDLFVHVGSSTEYRPGRGPLHEQTPLEPVSSFGAAKASASLLCRAHAHESGSQVAILRPFQVYGPGDNPRHLVPAAIAAAIDGSELRLAPSGRRDWVYVEDVAEACVLALARGTGGEFNVGTGRQWTNAEVVAAVAEACGREIRVRTDETATRPWDRDDWVADRTNVERVLGWQPRHDLQSGLARTVAWASAEFSVAP